MKCSLGISNFPRDRHTFPFCFPLFLCIVHSMSLLAILWNSVFSQVCLSLTPLPFTSLLFSAICKAPSDNDFAFLHFFFIGMVLVTTSCQSVSQFSCSVVPDSLRLHELQHARPPCPSPTPRIHSDSRPSSQ